MNCENERERERERESVVMDGGVKSCILHVGKLMKGDQFLWRVDL